MKNTSSIHSFPAPNSSSPFALPSGSATVLTRIGYSPHTMRYSPAGTDSHLRTVSIGRPTLQQPIRAMHLDVGVRFGERLRQLRRDAGLTQIDMAVAFGIDRSYISDVECGKKGISLATLEVLAIGFKVSLSELLRDV